MCSFDNGSSVLKYEGETRSITQRMALTKDKKKPGLDLTVASGKQNPVI